MLVLFAGLPPLAGGLGLAGLSGLAKPTLAGWWTLLVALPLFWFLLGRWLWRFITWGLLLRDIATAANLETARDLAP